MMMSPIITTLPITPPAIGPAFELELGESRPAEFGDAPVGDGMTEMEEELVAFGGGLLTKMRHPKRTCVAEIWGSNEKSDGLAGPVQDST